MTPENKFAVFIRAPHQPVIAGFALAFLFQTFSLIKMRPAIGKAAREGGASSSARGPFEGKSLSSAATGKTGGNDGAASWLPFFRAKE
jgi:hypothetical protein